MPEIDNQGYDCRISYLDSSGKTLGEKLRRSHAPRMPPVLLQLDAQACKSRTFLEDDPIVEVECSKIVDLPILI